jgi:hypothetical protein
MNNQEKSRLSECLWVDLKTHQQKRDFILLGRAVNTGIIAHTIQNALAYDYNIIIELKKDNTELLHRIVELEKALTLTSNELSVAIDEINSKLTINICSTDLDEPNYWDKETCHINQILINKPKQ